MALIPDRLDKDNVNFTWKVTTKPSIEPITNDEVKLYARIDGSSEDDLIDGFIQAVREATEKFLGRALINQTITAVFDAWFSDLIELPRPPLVSVTELRTVGEDEDYGSKIRGIFNEKFNASYKKAINESLEK